MTVKIPDNLQAGEIIDSRYQIKKFLGGGRVGKVYLARDTHNNKDVAVKILADYPYSERQKNVFDREFNAVKSLSHPGVVKVHDQGDGYYTMEHIEGESLSHSKHGEISHIFELGIDITRALDYIHRQGVIHRDLKPENIKITPSGQVKILDFGFAISSAITDLATSDTIVGTLDYMAPEVIKDFAVDPRADLYSLGIIFYELITGKLPFKSADIVTTVIKQVEMTPTALRDFNPYITPGFEAIVMKLISKSPAKRFQAADELLTAMMKLAGRSEIINIKVEKGREFLMEPDFQSREKELKRLFNILKKSQKGRGVLALVNGEEGLGKTRLIRHFSKTHIDDSKIFLEINCDSSAGASFASFAQAIYRLFDILENKNSPYLNDIAERWGAILLPIIPALTHKNYMQNAPGKPLSPEDPPAFHLCRFLLETCRRHPLVIFIDNLQWLSPEECELLLTLSQETQNNSMFICGAYRKSFESSGAPFSAVLPRLKLKKLCEEIPLAPLERPELESMILSMIDGEKLEEEVIKRIYEVSRGIPLLAEETLKSMSDDGLVYRKGGRWHVEVDDIRKIRRPALLEDALIEKYGSLDKKSALIMKIAAVMGQPFPRFFIEQICKINPSDLAELIPLLMQQGFLVETGSKGVEVYISIGSPRLAELIYEKTTHKMRQKLHEEIAKALEQLSSQEDHIESLARHYRHTRHYDKGLHYLIRAAELCEKNCAYSNAIDYYEQAIELAQHKKSSRRILALLTKLGHAHSRNGRHDKALEYYCKGLDLAKTKGYDEEEFHKGIGLVYQQKSQFSEALFHFEILLGMLRPKKKNLCEELGLTASVHIAMGTYEEAEVLLKEALSLAKRDKKKELQASMYRLFAEVHFIRGYWESSANYFTRALELLQNSEDRYLKSLINRGQAQVYIRKGQPEIAYKYLENTLYFCHLTGDRDLQVLVENDLGMLLEYQGELNQAMEIYRENLEFSEDFKIKQGIAYACMHLARVTILCERPTEAMQYLQRSMEIFIDLQMARQVGECNYLLGELYGEMAEYPKALKAFKAGEKAFMSVRSKWQLAGIYAGMFRIYLKLDKREKANKVLNKTLKVAKKYNVEIMLGRIHNDYGTFCAINNLPKEVLEHFITALVFLEKVTCKFELAQVYYDYGKALLEFERKGDRGFVKVAVHQLQKAKEIYRKAGLQPKLNKTMRLIKECEHEQSDTLYKKDLVIKLRELGRELADLERESIHEFAGIKKELLSLLGDDMDRGELLAEIEKKISGAKENLLERLHELERQNATLVSRVEELKAEREGLLTLQKISNTINSVLDSQKLLNMVMDMVIKELRAERGFIVLIDQEDKFTYKAARNIDREELSDKDSNLSYSIVKKVIKTGEPVLTSDAQADGRFRSQSIMDLKLRSIICVPFKIKDKVLGAVYVDNRFVSGLFTERELEFLVAFSNQAAIAIENAFLYEELTEKERMEQELAIAARIQGGLLPKNLPEVPGIEVYGTMNPAREVGGDYYDFIVSPDNQSLSIVIGDVSGKGIPAGLVMVMARLILHYFLADSEVSPKGTLLAANRLLKDNTEPFIFMSMLLLRWQAEEQKFIYSGAGHENLIICYSKSNRLEAIPAGGVVLGVKDNIEDFLEEKELILEKGDCIILYTDGVTESLSNTGEMLELDGFLEMVRKHMGKNPRMLVKSLLADLEEFTGGAEQHDDITLTVIKKL